MKNDYSSEIGVSDYPQVPNNCTKNLMAYEVQVSKWIMLPLLPCRKCPSHQVINPSLRV